MYRFLLALLLLASPLAAKAEQPVIVFAAASLKAPLTAIADAWAAKGHPKLVIALDSSGTLAKQIEAGAPAAIFFSADEKWMDFLASKNLLVAASRKDVLTNTLVLVAPVGHAKPVKIGSNIDLAPVLRGGRLAVGDTASVPAGIYAKQALTRLGAWDAVKDHLAVAANVRAALLLVEQGEAPAGIVYGTDAKSSTKVQVIGSFPPQSHDPIIYPAALLAAAGGSAPARAVLAFLEGPQARAIFARNGFGVK